jgi:hypothetical protein
VHDLDVDAVEIHVLEDVFRITFRHPAPGLAVARDGPALVPGRVQLPEDPGAALDERLDLEVFLPDRAVAQVLREARAKEVGGLEEVPVRRDDEILLGHRCDLPARRRGSERDPTVRGPRR